MLILKQFYLIIILTLIFGNYNKYILTQEIENNREIITEQVGSRMDSLESIINELKIGESINKSELGIQTGIFSIIVILLLAGVTFINMRFYKSKINQLEEKYGIVKKDNYKLNLKIERAYSNAQFETALREIKEDAYGPALMFLFLSLSSVLKSINIREKLQYYDFEDQESELLESRVHYFNLILDGIENYEYEDRLEAIKYIKKNEKYIYEVLSRYFSFNMTYLRDEYLEISSRISSLLGELKQVRE